MTSTYALVVPLYKSASGLDALVHAISGISEQLDGPLDVIFVDDACPENSGHLLAIRHLPFNAKIIWHSRNFGAFSAIRTGIEYAEQDYIAVMAADLQEPPSLITEFFETLKTGEVDVTMGVRRSRNDPGFSKMLSGLYWWTYRRFVLPELPPGGVDIFALTRKASRALIGLSEQNSSLISQLFWIGFRRKFVPYDRLERQSGTSAWSLGKKLNYMMDSIFSFTDLPVRLAFWGGIFGVVLSVFYALFVLVQRLLGNVDEPGFAALIMVMVFIGSLNVLFLGVLGQYTWRSFQNTLNRPSHIVRKIEVIKGD